LKIPIDLGTARVLVRHHVKEFWPESGPAPEDFLRAMETPWQLQTLVRGFRPEEAKFLLSETLMCECVFLKRVPSDMVADLAAIGVPDPTSELELLQKEIAKLRASLKNARGQKVKKAALKKRTPKGRKTR
jgi:hypothetical protein